ncbi:DUF4395 domain-containing protein [Sulfurimonas sp. HSL-1716]|uniref:DUF4395 domain-containing protein n=1 Tax=Hydrocurvibacter sulfurireducens TaxID=3131937 RepID=UPI0031F81DAD
MYRLKNDYYYANKALKGNMMTSTCPIIFKQIDATVTRVSSVYILLFVVLFLTTSQIFFIYFAAMDFLMRLYFLKQYSLIYQLSIATKKVFSLKTYMADAGAKRLAAGFGLFFMLLLIAEYHLRLDILLFVTTAVFLLCGLLETFFGYCIGCKVYFVIKKIYPDFME